MDEEEELAALGRSEAEEAGEIPRGPIKGVGRISLTRCLFGVPEGLLGWLTHRRCKPGRKQPTRPEDRPGSSFEGCTGM